VVSFSQHFCGMRVRLVAGVVFRGQHDITPGTEGTVTGTCRGIPQVDFGGSPVLVAPHLLEVVALPDGSNLPAVENDWDFYALVARTGGQHGG